jgi:hypothetical protein
VEATVKIFGAKRADTSLHLLYASSTDFCRIFKADMDGLYLLALLLTADSGLAERCFVLGLEDSKSGNPVFKQWAQSWARRTIITNAIRAIVPRPDNNASPPAFNLGPQNTRVPSELAAVLGLRTFDRFAFVMSVLEGYSEGDCRLLLNCSSAELTQARILALQQLGSLAERHRKTENAVQLHSKEDNSELRLAPGMVRQLTVSA